MPRSRRVAVSLILVAALTTACSDAADPVTPVAQPGTTPSGSTTPAGEPAPTGAGECATVQRAYLAWQNPALPNTAAGLATAAEADLESAADRSETLATVAKRYDNPAAKLLHNTAVAHSFMLSSLHLDKLTGGDVDGKAAGAADSAGRLESSYRAWKTAVCS
ncbi:MULTISPECIES: hypothetical protein [Micromonospora]|uniref:Lipoprotein n=1 Tax=Micromonospora yangpuensis TaxID=683228 RepID=A0A1C6V2Q9_9ACTN|nr:hypothetical protein [Micromonospora yangpuensis]SCL60622.1 hypothetical protein GA0070617_4432 [Micromonospora yangpuensis]